MALKVVDLDIREDIREVVEEVKCGEIHIFREVQTPYQEFVPDSSKMEHIGSYPMISFRDSRGYSRYQMGMIGTGDVQCTIALPDKPIEAGMYAYLNFSDDIAVVVGTIVSQATGLSTLVNINISTRESPPYTYQQVKEMFREVFLVATT